MADNNEDINPKHGQMTLLNLPTELLVKFVNFIQPN